MSSSFALSPPRTRRRFRESAPGSSRSSVGPSPVWASSWAANLAAAAFPSSMVWAISTSSSALSSGTRPISLRYVWTGSSALPPDSPLEADRFPFVSRRNSGLEVAVGSLGGPVALARRNLDKEILFLVLDERDALGRHAVDQDHQHLGRQLNGVQRLDQLGLCELPLVATDCEHRVEVDLRHSGRERDMRDRRERLGRRRRRRRVHSLVLDRDRRIVLHLRPTTVTLCLARPTTLPTDRRRRAQRSDLRVGPARGALARSLLLATATSRPPRATAPPPRRERVAPLRAGVP